MSESIARWSIDELRARYELEPELFDYFVEGVYDKELLTQQPHCIANRISMYEIDCVDIPNDMLVKYGFTSGNKQRVVALSHELASLPIESKVRCLVDRDLDHWFEACTSNDRLRWTVYCSIESHFITEQCANDVLMKSGRAKIGDFANFFISLETVLKQLYALRLVDRQLNLHLSWPSQKKYLSSLADEIKFNASGYIKALLLENGKISIQKPFQSTYEDWVKKLNCDIRNSARGHDYTNLLGWSMREFGGHKDFANPNSIERILVLLAKSVDSLSLEIQ